MIGTLDIAMSEAVWQAQAEEDKLLRRPCSLCGFHSTAAAITSILVMARAGASGAWLSNGELVGTTLTVCAQCVHGMVLAAARNGDPAVWVQEMEAARSRELLERAR